MMKFTFAAAVATVTLALGIGNVQAASYAYAILNSINPFVGDLTNASANATTGDGITIYEDDDSSVDFAASGNSNGFSASDDDDFHLNRTLFATGGGVIFTDRYLFTFADAAVGASAKGKATVHYAPDENNATTSATFSIFADLNNNGVADDGAALAVINLTDVATHNNGSLYLPGLTTGVTYLLEVSGVLDSAVSNAAYQFSFATTVPLPPALLLLGTSVAALFGFAGLRKRSNAAA